MPKEIKQYQCEFCGRLYHTVADAEECENSHNTVVSIKEALYSRNSRFNDTPEALIVVMSNGAEVQYDRHEFRL